MVLTSDLSLVECERALHRLDSLGLLSPTQIADLRDRLRIVTTHWTFMALDREVVESAKDSFPVEPVRSLDALHLASALRAADLLPGLAILSLDQRIRDNALPLGLPVHPT